MQRWIWIVGLCVASGCMRCDSAVRDGAPESGRKPDAATLAHWQRTYLSDPSYDKPATSRWRAQLLRPPTNAPRPVIEGDYALKRYGKSWNYDDGTVCGIDAFEGIANQRVEEGVLKFCTVATNAIFYWGDLWNKHEKMSLEAIGFDDTAKKEMWPQYGMEVRIRQSKPASVWRTRARTYRTGVPENVDLKGTEWQILHLLLPATPRSDCLIVTAGLETDTPDNEIEIDYVKIGRYQARQYYRLELDLPDNAVDARCHVYCPFGYELFVNGAQAGAHVYGFGQESLLFSLEGWQKHLKKGKNVIGLTAHTRLIQALWKNSMVAAEGVITLADGRQVRFQTDQNWVCTANAQGNTAWSMPDNKASGWQPAAVVTSMKEFAHKNMSFRFREPYYQGPVFVTHADRRSPVYHARDPVRLAVGVPRRTDGTEWKLSVSLQDAFDNSLVSTNAYAFRKGGKPAESWQVPWTFEAEGLPPSVYNLDIAAECADGQKDTRRFEFAVTGPIAMRPDNGATFDGAMKLKLVDAVDCANTNPAHPLLEFNLNDRADPGYWKYAGVNLKPEDYQDRIVDSPLGHYRELGRYPDYAMWILKPKNPYRPHVLLVTYPDNADRVLDVAVSMPNRIVPMAIGQVFTLPIVTGFGYPLSHTMRTAESVFWPSEPDVIVLAVNPFKPAWFERSALAKIELFEVEDDLPALTIAAPNQERLIGYTHERGIYGESFFDRYYGGPAPVGPYTQRLMTDAPGVLREQFRLAANAARWLKFTGQNLHAFGCWQYNQVHGKCKYTMDGIGEGWKTTYAPMDVIASMFDDNDLAFMLMTEFNDHALLNPYDAVVSDCDVRQGAETVRFVDIEGSQSRPNGSNHNFMAPTVREFLLQMWRDLADDYKQFKSFKGLYNLTNAGGVSQGQPSFLWGMYTTGLKADPLRYGWDDLSVKRFAQATGIKIPVDQKDQYRFMKRHDWVLEHARKEWIAWRCRELKAMIDEGAAAMREVRPDLRFTVMFGDPATEAVSHMAGAKDFLETERERGRDWSLYKDDPNVTIAFLLMMNDRFRIGRQFMDASREFMLDKDIQKAMALGHSSGAALKACVNEFGGVIKATNWPWSGFYGWFFSPGPPAEHYRDSFVNLVPYADPAQITHTFTDCGIESGYGQALRGILADWRTMPVGDYEVLKRNGLDKNIVIRKLTTPLNGRAYFQLINPEWWTANVVLKFPEKTRITRLSSGEALDTDANGRLAIPLVNYGIASFASDKAAPASAEAEVAKGGRDYVAKAIKELEAGDTIAQALAAGEIRNARTAFAEGDMVTAYRSVQWAKLHGQVGWAMMKLGNNDKIYPSAWNIIGPFDNLSNRNFNVSQGPESDILAGKVPAASYAGQAGKPVAWHAVVPEKCVQGQVDLNGLFGRPDWVTAYATFTLKSPQARKAFFFIGSDDGYRLWVNGKLVGELDQARASATMQEVYQVDLLEGDNVILLKITEQIGGYNFYFSMMDDQGRALEDCATDPPAPVIKKLTDSLGLLLRMDETLSDAQGRILLKDASGHSNHFYFVREVTDENGRTKSKTYLTQEDPCIRLVANGKFGKALRLAKPPNGEAYADYRPAQSPLEPYLDNSFTLEAWIQFEQPSREWAGAIVRGPRIAFFESAVGLHFITIPNYYSKGRETIAVPQCLLMPSDTSSCGPCAARLGVWDAGRWYHLAMVFNQEAHSLALFVDGKEAVAIPLDRNVRGRRIRSQDYRIGGSPVPMLIAELRVTARALKPYELGYFADTKP